MRILGGIWQHLLSPATGSIPISRENFSLVSAWPSARAKAAWPPLLCPAKASLSRLGSTPVGSTDWSPSDSQLVTAAAEVMSSSEYGDTTMD